MLATLVCGFLFVVLADGRSAVSPTEILASKSVPAANDCGVKCLHLYLRMLGHDVDENEIRAECQIKSDGLTLADLVSAGGRFGISIDGVYANGDELSRLPVPSIGLLEADSTGDGVGHFVVLLEIGEQAVVVADPRYESLITVPRPAFQRISSGCFLIQRSRVSVARLCGFGLGIAALGAALVSVRRRISLKSRRSVLAATLIVAATSLGCGGGASTKQYVAKRVLEVDQEVVELGSVPADQRQKAEFRVTNRGSVGVTIELANSCGCINARLEPPVKLEPQQSAKVIVEIDPTGKFGAFVESVFLRPVEAGEERQLNVRAAVDGVWLERNRLTLHASEKTAVKMELGGFVSSNRMDRRLVAAELDLNDVVIDVANLREQSIPTAHNGSSFKWIVPLVTKSDDWKRQLGTHRGSLTYELAGMTKRIDFSVYVLP